MNQEDKRLGMDQKISRRDYMNASLLASGGLLLGGVCPMDLMAQNKADWDGYGGIGDYSTSNGNTYEVMTAGHQIRDRAYETLPKDVTDTGEEFDCVVVGGGISGLAAALFFGRKAPKGSTCLILENHAIFGGEARRNEFKINGGRLIAHQGSAMFFPQTAGTFLDGFYRSIGIEQEKFRYQEWDSKTKEAELPLPRTPYTEGGKSSALFFGPRFGKEEGVLLADPWGKKLDGAPISEKTRNELLTVHTSSPRPLPKQHGDDLSRYLDSITLEDELMARHKISRETVRTFLSPVSGGGAGMGADALSAYAEYAADVLLPWDYEKGAQMFPGGNAGVARHIVRELIPGAIPTTANMEAVCRSSVNFASLDRPHQARRIRLRSTAVWVQHEGEPAKASAVKIIYARDGRLYSLRARSVIVAGGSWTAKHILKDLPETHRNAYGHFYRAPCLMANVALRNWRFLYKLGLNECQWFEGIGNYFAIRKVAPWGGVPAEISPDSPVVLTLKILFSTPGKPIGEQVTRGRAELYSTPFRDYERRIREQLSMVLASTGFDARRDIGAVILNRWGHAYLSAQPGFFFGKEGMPAPGEVLRNNPVGRIAFANSDVTGIMDHRASIQEANRAVTQVTSQL